MNLTSMYARHRLQGVPLSPESRQKLQHARKARGLSRTDLARQIGMQAVHLGRLETGKANPRWDVLERWCRAVGCGVRVEVPK